MARGEVWWQAFHFIQSDGTPHFGAFGPPSEASYRPVGPPRRSERAARKFIPNEKEQRKGEGYVVRQIWPE